MDVEKIFQEVYIRQTKYSEVEELLDIDRTTLQTVLMEIAKERQEEIELLKRFRRIYNSKKKLKQKGEWEFRDFEHFYHWICNQYEKQEHRCDYCGIKEDLVRELMRGYFSHGKRKTRGNYLELDRINPVSNIYSEKNCVLVCYFCNNDKSDLFTRDEYIQFIKDRKGFLEQLKERVK